MGGTGVIDRFLGVFTQYIDSGFGLVQGDVRWLAGVLIAIDITLAGLFWAMAPDEDVLARLIKKTLYIGVFAFIIGNFNNLAQIIYNSFAGLGIEAGGGTLSQAQLLQPGRLAQVGIDAGQPILASISSLMGFTSFFDNFIQIAILLIAWLIVVISFFIMAIQLFVSLIEFKLTTLAGFVLVPFGLFGRTAFLAEKVLGNVVSSGVKVLVLAVIVGIGSTIFGQFTSGFNNPPTISDALTLILAALSLLGLTIFAPGIANGLIAGGPQLGAGAAVGTGLAVAGIGAAGAALAAGGLGAAGGAIAGTARAGASVAGGATAAYRAGGLSGVAQAGASAATSPLRRAAASLRESFAAGGQAATGGASPARGERGGPGRSLGSAGLGEPHEAQSDHQSRRLRRRPRHPLRRSSQRRRRRRSLRRGIVHVPATDRPLRRDTRFRNALPESRPGLGRPDRIGPRPGEELAARLLRHAGAQRRSGRRPRLAVGARHDHAMGRAGRQAWPGASGGAGRRRLSPDRPADRLASRPLHRGGARAFRPIRSCCGRTGSKPMTTSPTRARWC